jgi:hypothetical protein
VVNDLVRFGIFPKKKLAPKKKEDERKASKFFHPKIGFSRQFSLPTPPPLLLVESVSCFVFFNCLRLQILIKIKFFFRLPKEIHFNLMRHSLDFAKDFRLPLSLSPTRGRHDE